MAYIPSSSNYEEIIYSGDAKHRIRIWFNEVELENANTYCEKLTMKNRVLADDGNNIFSLDNFHSKELTLILHNISLETIQDQVRISIGTLVGDNTYEDVPIGIFNIQDTPVTDKDKITIKLRDNAVLFDFDYNAKPLIDANDGSATLLQILQDMCTKANVQTDISSFLNSTKEIGIYDSTIKARTYVSYIAEQAGCIASIDRQGKLIFASLNDLEVKRIPRSVLEKYELGEPFSIDRIVYEMGNVKFQTSDDETLDTLYINSANPYISNQEQITALFNEIGTFNIDSIKTGKVLGDPAIDSYDIIEIYDDRNNTEPVLFKTLATYNMTFNGKITVNYETLIEKSKRAENITKNSEATFKKGIKQEIDTINGTLSILDEEVGELLVDGTLEKTAEGYPVEIEDAGNYNIVSNVISGKNEQETRSGKNLLKNTNVNSGDNNFWWQYSTFDEATRTLTRSTTSTNESFIYHRLNGLKSNTTYTLSLYAKSNGYVKGMDLFCFNQNTQGIKSVYHLSLTTEFQKYTFTFTTASDVDYSTDARIRIDNNGTTTSGTEAILTVKDVMLVEGTDTEYEDYGAMPSPDYPSEVETLQGVTNLFELPESETKNGITYTKNNDGSFNIEGTASANCEFDMYVPISSSNLIDGETYTLSTSEIGVRIQVVLYNGSTWLRTPFNISQSSTTRTATNSMNLTNVTQVRYMLSVTSGTTINLSNIKIQFEKGSIAHNPVPYGTWLEERTRGKNIVPSFDTGSLNGISFITDDDGVTTISGTSTSSVNYFKRFNKVLEAGTYIFNSNISFTPSINSSQLILKDKNNISLATINLWSTPSKTFTILEKTEISHYYFYSNANFSYDGTMAVQLEKVKENQTEPSQYEPYKENTALIDMNIYDENNEIVGNYEVLEEDTLTVKDNIATLDKKWGKIVLDGSENWDYIASGSYYRFGFKDEINPLMEISDTTSIPKIYVTHYTKKSWNDYINQNNSICMLHYSDWNYNAIRIRDDRFNNATDFKSWLQAQYEAGTPVTIYYKLATQETIELPCEILELHEGYNYIDLNDDTTNMEVTYLTDSKFNSIYALRTEYKQTEEKVAITSTRTDANEQAIRELSVGVDGVSISITDIQNSVSSQQSDINTLNNNVQNTDTALGNLQTALDNLNTKVNNMNYDFGTTELNINSTNDPNNTGISNKGLIVRNYNTIKTVANNKGLGTDDLIVTKTAQIGYLKFVKSVDENNEPVTDIHHLVSNIQDVSDLVGDN